MVGSGNLLNITRPLGMLHTELWMETTPTAHSLRRGGPDDATWNFCETSRLTFVLDPLGLFIFLSLEQLWGEIDVSRCFVLTIFSLEHHKDRKSNVLSSGSGKVEAFHDFILPRSLGIISYLVFVDNTVKHFYSFFLLIYSILFMILAIFISVTNC